MLGKVNNELILAWSVPYSAKVATELLQGGGKVSEVVPLQYKNKESPMGSSQAWLDIKNSESFSFKMPMNYSECIRSSEN